MWKCDNEDLMLAIITLLLTLAVLLTNANAATSTLTGTVVDAQGNPVNGTMTMQLPVPAVDTATNVNIPAVPVAYVLVNGVIQSGPPLFDVGSATTTLQPTNLYYIGKVYDTTGALIETGYFVVTGATFNLGAAIPTAITTSNIFYISPSSLSGNNVWTGTNTFTILPSFPVQTANTFFSGPTSGSPAVPSFRGIINTDLTGAVFGASGLNHSVGAVPDPGATAGTQRFLREDATWQTPTTAGEANTSYVAGACGSHNTNCGTPYSTTSTTFVAVDSTYLSITLSSAFNTAGTKYTCWASGNVLTGPGSDEAYVGIQVGSTMAIAQEIGASGSTDYIPFSMMFSCGALNGPACASGTQTVQLMWATNAGQTIDMRNGAASGVLTTSYPTMMCQIIPST